MILQSCCKANRLKSRAGIYITFHILNTRNCKSVLLPLLLDKSAGSGFGRTERAQGSGQGSAEALG